MIWVIIGIIVIAFIAILVITDIVNQKNTKEKILTLFRSGNVLVCGHKGKGKDLLFYWVINTREKAGEIHAANIPYTEKTKIRQPKEYSLECNTLKDFMKGDIKLETKKFTLKEDYYISEVGLYLPNWGRNTLEKDKQLSTLPITMALSRQLGEFNIHSNTQSFNRPWDKLREQADYCIWCEESKVNKKTRRAKITMILYNRIESAYTHIQPFEARRSFLLGIKNKTDLASAVVHNAKYGYIERVILRFKLPKNKFMYDTHYFYKKFYNKDFPKDI